MTNSLLTESWLQKLSSYHRLYLGFSGGLDSTVLLHTLAQQANLCDKLQAVHIHHGLSANADAWQIHCQQFCNRIAVPLIHKQVQFDRSGNIEENARNARYQVFASLLKKNDALLLAHHADDQAETILLQLLRGAGIDGLAAMASSKAFAKGELLRPVLMHTRKMLEAYAAQHQLAWVEDESNQDSGFARNFLRQAIMPLLEKKWPVAVANLTRSAMHCQQAKNNLDALAEIDYQGLADQGNQLDLSLLLKLQESRMVNVLRFWFKNNQVRLPSTSLLNRIIKEVILASADAMPFVPWDDVVLRRYQQHLYLLKNKPSFDHPALIPWAKFPEPLTLAAIHLQAIASTKGIQVPAGSRVDLRFRQGGESFYWHGQTKQLKKLLQQWQIPPWKRDEIPLLYINGQLAAVVGFAISDHFYGENVENTYVINTI